MVTHIKTNKTIWKMTPPKSCARCKSKYWNEEPKRKSKRVYDCDACGEKHHDMISPTRGKALLRYLLRDIAEQDKRIKHLEDFAKKRGIKLNS